MNALKLPPIPVYILSSRRFVLSVAYGTSFQLSNVVGDPVSTKKFILKTDSSCLESTNAGT
jgi:hypothetical protein